MPFSIETVKGKKISSFAVILSYLYTHSGANDFPVTGGTSKRKAVANFSQELNFLEYFTWLPENIILKCGFLVSLAP